MSDYDKLREECQIFIKATGINEIAWGLILEEENKNLEKMPIFLQKQYSSTSTTVKGLRKFA